MEALDDDTIIHTVSFLQSKDLAHLAMTCRRFGLSPDSRTKLSLMSKAAFASVRKSSGHGAMEMLRVYEKSLIVRVSLAARVFTWFAMAALFWAVNWAAGLLSTREMQIEVDVRFNWIQYLLALLILPVANSLFWSESLGFDTNLSRCLVTAAPLLCVGYQHGLGWHVLFFCLVVVFGGTTFLDL